MGKKPGSGGTLVPTQRVAGATKKLLGDIRALIETARERMAQAVNAGLVTLHWSIGERVRREILGGKRAEYGEQVVSTLSRQLTAEYGRGFSRRNLFHMIRMAEVFPDPRIVQTLSAQLSWSHFLEIIHLKDPLQRDFYAEMCRTERWSVRGLRRKVGTMLFERTALSRKPAELAKKELAALRDEDRLTPDLVFRDPYYTTAEKRTQPPCLLERYSRREDRFLPAASAAGWGHANPASPEGTVETAGLEVQWVDSAAPFGAGRGWRPFRRLKPPASSCRPFGTQDRACAAVYVVSVA